MASARARLLGFLDEHHAMVFGASLLLAVSLRARVLSGLRETIYFRTLSPDEDTYHRWAAALADGTASAGYAPDFARLPALVFSFVYRVFGVNAFYVRVLNLLLGLVICALAYLCGRVLYGRGAGALAALLCALDKSLVFYSVSALGTCLGVFLFELAFLFAVVLWVGPTRLRAPSALALAAAAGLLVNARGNAIVVLALLVPGLWWARRDPERSRFFPLQIALASCAVYIACAALSGEIGGPRAGFNLYIGNNPDNPAPYFRPVRFTASTPEQQAKGFVVEASRRAGTRLTPAQAERFFVAEVARAAFADPPPFVAHCLRKLHALVHASTADNNHDLRVLAPFLPALAWAFVPSWLGLALGLAGMLALGWDRRLQVGLTLAVLYGATLCMFFAGERLRAPLLPIVAPYAAAGFCAWLAPSAAGAVRLCSALGLCALIVLAQLPLLGADDVSGPTNMHALMLFQNNQLDAAERWYRRSLAMDGIDSEGARIGLAAILQKRGRLADAVAVLQALPDAHYEAASKYEWLGNLALAAHDPLAAARAYEASIKIDSSRDNAYKGLYIALRLLGADDAARAVDQQLDYVRSFQ